MEDLIKKYPVDRKKISCSGEGQKIGHPLVFLNMGEAQEIDCPYCNSKFFLKNN